MAPRAIWVYVFRYAEGFRVYFPNGDRNYDAEGDFALRFFDTRRALKRKKLYFIMKLELKKKKLIIRMEFKQAYGQIGFPMDKKTKKGISPMEKEIVFGPHGIKMEIKNYRQHIPMANLMGNTQVGLMVVLLKKKKVII